MIYDTSLDSIQGKVVDGARITAEEAVRLYHALSLPELGALADVVRERKHPERTVTYIIDRNINYTNVCDVYCTFCAFMREERDDDSDVQEIGHPQCVREDGQRRSPHKSGTRFGQPAFVEVGEVLVGVLCHEHAQHGIAQEFQPLIRCN